MIDERKNIQMTVRDIINETSQKLEAAGIPSARLDAEVLLAFCLNCDRAEFFKNPERQMSQDQMTAFQKMIARRLAFEPVAYITGRKAFWSFTLEVNPDVLIPRPDTEILTTINLYKAKQEKEKVVASAQKEMVRDNRESVSTKTRAIPIMKNLAGELDRNKQKKKFFKL